MPGILAVKHEAATCSTVKTKSMSVANDTPTLFLGRAETDSPVRPPS